MSSIINIITNNAWISVLSAVIPPVAFAVAYLIGTSRASRFGVPLRYVRVSVYDCVDVIVITIIAIISGVIMPLWLFTSVLDRLNVISIIGFSFILLSASYLMLLVVLIKLILRRKWGKGWKIIAIVVAIVATAVACKLIAYSIAGCKPIEIFIIHLLIMPVLYYIWVSFRLSGNYETELICKIKCKDYIIALRHVGKLWALFPCYIDENERTIYYEKNKYILKSMQDIDNFITVKGYGFKHKVEKASIVKKNKAIKYTNWSKWL